MDDESLSRQGNVDAAVNVKLFGLDRLLEAMKDQESMGAKKGRESKVFV